MNYTLDDDKSADEIIKSAFSYMIKARLAVMSSDDGTFHNLITYIYGDDIINIQILFNLQGRIRILSGDNVIFENATQYITSTKYTNIVVHIDTDNASIYIDKNKIATINSDSRLTNMIPSQFNIGYTQQANQSTTCLVSDFYIINDSITLDNLFKISQLNHRIKHFYNEQSALMKSTISNGSETILNRNIEYKDSTCLVNNETFNIKQEQYENTYFYDTLTNNVTIYFNHLNHQHVRYTYDSFNRLIKEEYFLWDSDLIKETHEYSYNDNGNIIKETITYGNLRKTETINYDYDVYWRLNDYNGKRIEYEDVNPYLPTSYDGDYLKWRHNQLIRYKNINNSCQFCYNELGYRIMKKSGTHLFYYFYEQDRLIYQIKENVKTSKREEMVFGSFKFNGVFVGFTQNDFKKSWGKTKRKHK